LPGLTGLWQVSDKDNTTFEEMIDFDLKYVRSQSLGMDIAILLKTLPAVISQTYQVRRKKREAMRAGSSVTQSSEQPSFPPTSV
jgi:lipopolysaccharide/colanic/teichoic acid biosynthesis glycosyltransferase